MPILTQSHSQFKSWLEQKMFQQRIPLAGTIELTARCNFQCTHCYMGTMRSDSSQMPTVLVQEVLQQVADAGCLSMGFTGGEPLFRDDYKEIHATAHGLGFWISLLTNAERIDAPMVRFLAAHPPRSVEVSLYGGDEESYFEVTKKAGAYTRVCANIDRMLDAGIHVSLKSVLLTPVVRSLDALLAFAAQRQLEVTFDPSVTPTLDKDLSPTHLRIGPRCAVQIEIDSLQKKKKLTEYHQRIQSAHIQPNDPICGAGYNGFHVDYKGRLLGCLMLREPSYDLNQFSFADAWEQLGKMERPSFPKDSRCAGCDVRHLCSYCPGAATCGELPPQSDESFYCQVAKSRAELLK